MRALRSSLLVLLVLLVLGSSLFLLGDGYARSQAERELAERVQVSGDLPEAPSVSVGGERFLPQVFRGRYDEVELAVPSLVQDGGEARDVRVRLSGVAFRAAEVASSDPVPVEDVRITGLVPLEHISSQLPAGVRLVPGPSVPLVEAEALFMGRTLTVRGVPSLELDGPVIRVEVSDVVVVGPDARIPDSVTRALLGSVEVPLPELPMGLVVEEVTLVPDGVRFLATGEDVLLPR